jgi:hypothetical protein
LTRNDVQVNHCTFSITNSLITMRDFDYMSAEEKEEILDQIKDLPAELQDPVDLLTQTFNELSKDWSCALDELDTIYVDIKKDYSGNLFDKIDKSGNLRLISE